MEIRQALAAVVERQDLTLAESTATFNQIMSGDATPAQIGALLAALRIKGETVDEIAGAASAMRSHSSKVEVAHKHLVDTCGTGGSGHKLFNISTAAAFVAAAAGAKVAKHGNRKMTSNSGSADVLEQAGVNLSLSSEQIATCILEVGVGFMFAAQHHSAMRYAAPVRQEIGFRTLMNVLGPMTNPAGASRQVIGVFSPAWQRTVAEVLNRLGSEHVMVVHSEGLDEIRLGRLTQVVELKDGQIHEYTIDPSTFDIAREEDVTLCADDTQHSLTLIKQSLTDPESAAADIVSLNAGAAIYVSGVATSLANGVTMAQDAIATGLAKERFDELVRVSKMMGEA